MSTMKSKNETIEHIKTLIEENSLGEIKASSIKESQSLIEEIGIDSLDFAAIMLGCEKWLQIKVKEDQVDWSKVRTVEQLADVLTKSQHESH